MAKYQKTKYTTRSFVLLALLLAALTLGLIAVARGNQFKRSGAALPIPVTPCSGNWNQTDCFIVTNPTAAPIRFAYLIDCYDTAYCEDKSSIVTLQPGAKIVLGQASGCSGWQLDLNWSSPNTALTSGKWQWGAVVEKNPTAVCSCNYAELNIQPKI